MDEADLAFYPDKNVKAGLAAPRMLHNDMGYRYLFRVEEEQLVRRFGT
ncbi:hypothetical protein [Lentzea sp. CA-135723]